MSPEELDRLLALDPAWRAEVRDRWRGLMDLVVWGDLQTAQAGSLTRLRKRALDLGERWRSFFNPRDWIPQPRERLKNALGSALAVRDSLALFERAAREVQGGRDHPELTQLVAELQRAVSGPLLDLQNRWATALEALNRAGRDSQE